jgi:hypothetical protein
MARTIQEIKKDMTDAWMGNEDVRAKYNLLPTDIFEDKFYKASIENILFYVVAFALHVYERIFDTKSDELTAYVDAMRPHTREWYIKMMKQYQHGDIFNESLGCYETIDESKQIVKYCSLSTNTSGVLEYKVAQDDGSGNPEVIPQNIISSIQSYIERVKEDAGVRCKIYSNPSDKFKCKIDILYDPTVLNANGSKVSDPGSFPVLDAIRDYFISFPFDGVFSNMGITDAIQAVVGVRIPQILESWAKKELAGANWEQIISTYNPRSGYMTFNQNDIDIIYHL